ncbi:hypothetical protein ABK905_18255 [Acerihabitans sp. KWT182]|uniref:Uncharacterized protein n=1 Tax=Acerihabitans sp. KWT182 TaxID=3157919 RepID=A0AAU7Q871_9GAMM
MRKNIIYDIQHNCQLSEIDHRSIFQFYPMVNLWYDIQVADFSGLKLIHLTSQPISVHEVYLSCFGREFYQETLYSPAKYDMHTCYASLYGKSGGYQYNTAEVVLAIRAYAQSEPGLFKQIMQKKK